MDREDVINKVFPHSLFGYDPVAVDAFLDEVIREFDRMTNTIDVLQFRLAQELSEAKQNNDLLSAELHRQGYESRVEQVMDIDIVDAQPQPEKEEAPVHGEPEAEEPQTEKEAGDGDPFAEVLERDAEADASGPVKEIGREAGEEAKKKRKHKRKNKH